MADAKYGREITINNSRLCVLLLQREWGLVMP